MSQPQVLKMAVCLFNGVQLLDYAGSMDLFGFLNASDVDSAVVSHNPRYTLDFTYVGPAAKVRPTSGPAVECTATFADLLESDTQFDVLLVPGGRGTRPLNISQDFLHFLAKQAPGAKYVLSICTGSWALAQAGVLDGHRATTNKSLFTLVKKETSQSIQWVPKARWIVDGRIWTASGVTAGIDMACAWLEHLVGKEVTLAIRADIEYSNRVQDDDDWADYWGLTTRD
ncbi:transcriptional regulator [Auricularia subglabra TFB-10046 SS5]|nr:transcriptional regulator [Auricularia subglabra TFB-10046 SS5]